MTTLKDMQAHAQEVEGQAGAEYKYLTQVNEFLLRAQDEVKADKVKDAHGHMQHAIRELQTVASRTERYLQRAENKQLMEMKELMEHLPQSLIAQLKEIGQDLRVFLGDVLKNLSRFEGDLRAKLEAIQKSLEVKSLEPAQRMVIVGQIKEIRDLITNLRKELAGAITEEKKYQQLLAYLTKLAA